MQNRCAFGLIQTGQCDAEEDGEDCYLKNLPFGDGFGDVLREDVEEKVVPAGWRWSGDRFARDGSGGQGQANAGVAEIDGSESDDKGEGGHDLEVDEALDAHASHALQVSVACDAGDQRGQDEGSDDGLDEAQKDVAEDSQADSQRGCVEA